MIRGLELSRMESTEKGAMIWLSVPTDKTCLSVDRLQEGKRKKPPMSKVDFFFEIMLKYHTKLALKNGTSHFRLQNQLAFPSDEIACGDGTEMAPGFRAHQPKQRVSSPSDHPTGPFACSLGFWNRKIHNLVLSKEPWFFSRDISENDDPKSGVLVHSSADTHEKS